MKNLPNLLIVDDAPENLILLKANIKNNKVNLIQALSGEEALRKTQDIELALAIIDVRMPVMNGYELALKLNAKRSDDKVPVIFMTAENFNEMEVFKGYDNGAVDYIFKPYDNYILASKINVFLNLFNQKQSILSDAALLKKSANKLILANSALKKSEKIFKSYIDHAPDGVFVKDEKGKYLLVNKAASRITGYSKDELLRMSITDIIPEESWKDGMAHFRKLRTSGQAESIFLFNHKNGTQRWLSVEEIKLTKKTFLGFAKDITLQKNAEELLMKSERFLKETQNIAQLGSYTLYLKTGKWECSEILDEIFGINEDFEKSIDGWTSLIHPDCKIEIIEYFENDVIKNKKDFDKEYKIIRQHDNATRWVHDTGRLKLDAHQQPLCMIGTISDITYRKEAEEKIRLANVRLRQFIDSNVIGVIVATTDGEIIETNDYYLNIIQYSRKEFEEGKVNWIAITPHEWLPADHKAIIELRQKGSCTPYEKEYINKKGERVSVLISDAMLPGPEEQIVGFVLDITERKRAENEIQKWANIFKNVEWGVAATISMGMKIEIMNPAFAKMHGFTVTELINQSILDLFAPEVRDKLPEIFCIIHKKGHHIFESLHIRKDGTVFPVLLDTTEIKDISGKVLYRAFNVQDITERKRAEEELKNSLDQLHQLSQYIERVREDERVAISRELHDDLGQALTAVKIDLATIKQNVSETETIAKIDKVSALVSDTIRTVQRLTSQLRPEIIDDLGLESAIEWYSKEFAQRNNIDFLLDLDPNITFTADVSLIIFRIMQESLTNISRHAKASKIEIVLNQSKDAINFRISDNGIGISEVDINSKKSFGIISMRERAATLGGSFFISHEKDFGTVIKLILPLSDKINNKNRKYE